MNRHGARKRPVITTGMTWRCVEHLANETITATATNKQSGLLEYKYAHESNMKIPLID